MQDATVLEVIGQLNSVDSGSRRNSPSNKLALAGSDAPGRPQSVGVGGGDAGSARGAAPAVDSTQRVWQPEQFVAILAGLQFAVVILISQRRIPQANSAEFFVVLSMLMLTSAHTKILDFLPDGSRIHRDSDALAFVVVVVPVVLFMIIIELWFVALLFSYDPEVDLAELGQNAHTVLTIGKVFGIGKLLLVPGILFFPRLLRRYRSLQQNK